MAVQPPEQLLPVLNGVSLVMELCALGQETLTTLPASILEDPTASLSGHAGPEAVLALADSFGGLVSALTHYSRLFWARSRTRGAGD